MTEITVKTDGTKHGDVVGVIWIIEEIAYREKKSSWDVLQEIAVEMLKREIAE